MYSWDKIFHNYLKYVNTVASDKNVVSVVWEYFGAVFEREGDGDWAMKVFLWLEQEIVGQVRTTDLGRHLVIDHI